MAFAPSLKNNFVYFKESLELSLILSRLPPSPPSWWSMSAKALSARVDAMIEMGKFSEIRLTNRLGQALTLPVSVIREAGREMVFVITPNNIPNFLKKNAETIVFQLRELFGLDQRKFEFFEVQHADAGEHFLRWRFEWVGSSPLQQAPEPIVSESQRTYLLQVLARDSHAALIN